MDVKIKYDPYRMKTKMFVDGIDVCDTNQYAKFKDFIERGIPLQTWVEPIRYENWNGFVDELCDPERNDIVKIIFSGREIDFKALKNSLKWQNKQRDEYTKIELSFEHEEKLDDNKFSKDLENVVKELGKEWFKELIDKRGNTSVLNERYKNIKENYKFATNTEFKIVFTGTFSSGKSTVINYLIQHQILPVSQDTCTTKNCRIRHEMSYASNEISLLCLNKNDEVICKKEIFQNDEDCLKKFKEISPISDDDILSQYKDVNTIEIGLNLAHLYPKSVDQEKFTIVIVDTPGTDSAVSIENGVNEHAQKALKAVFDDCKPIIILCSEAERFEGKNIGEYLGQIVTENEADNGIFKDRFMFLLNKADRKRFESATVDEYKTEYSQYLTNSNKWSVDFGTQKHEVDFIPSIFLTSPLAAQAARNCADKYTGTITPAQKEERRVLRDFKEYIEEGDENYFFSEHCDIPEFQKEKIRKDFNDAINKKEFNNAVLLQSGMPALEYAIKDYIEKYAYPIKVKSLLCTFEDVLSDVAEFSEMEAKLLKQKIGKLGEKEDAREEGIKERDSKNKLRELLEEVGNDVLFKLDDLNRIKFDDSTLNKAFIDFKSNIEANASVKYIREKANTQITSSAKNEDDLRNEIKKIQENVEEEFENAYEKLDITFSKISNEHRNKVNQIYGELRENVDKLRKSELFKDPTFNFKNSSMWKNKFEKISSNTLNRNLSDSIDNKYNYETEYAFNEKKFDWQCSRNPIKKFGALFRRDFIEKTKKYMKVTIL